MKSKIIIALVFGCFFSTYGQSYVTYPQDGVYAGLESGIARVVVNGIFDNTMSETNNDFIDREYTRGFVSVNLGYGIYIGESFAGIEAHYSIYTEKISDAFVQDEFDYNVSIASKSEVDLIIGRKIGSKSLLTLRGGLAFSNIGLIADSNVGSKDYFIDNEWIGYSLGMGYVYGINETFSLKTKYNLTTFKNNKFPETDSKLVDNRFSLSLIYSIWSE